MNVIPKAFHSQGKLLLTAEYFVLDGALALALPVVRGQSLRVEKGEKEGLHWIAREPEGTWFEAQLDIADFNVLYSTDDEIALRLQHLLHAARTLQPSFLFNTWNLTVTTELEFSRKWGLGSSSTLVHALAGWAGIDPYRLLWKVSSGSGYDIACAGASGPILYQVRNQQPSVTPVKFDPVFKNSLYFVYLGRKQDSDAGISAFRNRQKFSDHATIKQINEITETLLTTNCLEEFSRLIMEHETIISGCLGMPPLRKTVFRDFPGEVKSLGAWGGDFALLASNSGREEISGFLARCGLNIFFSFDELILKYPDPSYDRT